jgi:hypothetical protein
MIKNTRSLAFEGDPSADRRLGPLSARGRWNLSPADDFSLAGSGHP